MLPIHSAGVSRKGNIFYTRWGKIKRQKDDQHGPRPISAIFLAPLVSH